jgi:hypothetical protein
LRPPFEARLRRAPQDDGYALHVIAHLLLRDRSRDGKAEEARRHHRHDFRCEEIDEFEPRVGLVDVMQDGYYGMFDRRAAAQFYPAVERARRVAAG